MTKLRTALALGCVLSASAGCATMVHGTNQDVKITSTPAGATVRIDPGGKTLTTPAETKLSRKNAYTVHVEHEGYKPSTGYIDRESSGAVWGNILFGGIIGLVVDYGNGAAYQLAPGLLHVDLESAAPESVPLVEGVEPSEASSQSLQSAAAQSQASSEQTEPPASSKDGVGPQ